jgi:hypothetical protein
MPPHKSGGSGFIVAAIVMLLLVGGLVLWKTRGKEEPKQATNVPPPPTTTQPPVLEQPPPPPPPPEPDAGEKKQPSNGKVKYTGGSGGCTGECKGTASAGLRSALRSRAGQARGCYERGLRQNAMLQGKIVVSIRVGPSGQVCSAGIASNSVGDPGVASCVLGMFRSGSFPAPQGGCVDAQVPMNFIPKS